MKILLGILLFSFFASPSLAERGQNTSQRQTAQQQSFAYYDVTYEGRIYRVALPYDGSVAFLWWDAGMVDGWQRLEYDPVLSSQVRCPQCYAYKSRYNSSLPILVGNWLSGTPTFTLHNPRGFE